MSSIGIILLVCALFIPKTTRMDVPSILYNAKSSVTKTLQEADIPENVIESFIANPSVETLKNYTSVIKYEGVDGNTFDKVVVQETHKEPSELVNALKSNPTMPISALFLILCGLCTSVMWGGIFNLAVEGLGKYTAQASGIFMMMVVGGGIMPLVQQKIAGAFGYIPSYWLVVGMVAYILFYALIGCRNVNTDIPVDDINEDEVLNAG